MLAGLPLPALADLDRADKLPPAEPARTAGLADLLRAYANFQHAALTPRKHPAELRETALLLGYLAREYSRGAEAHIEAARLAAEAMPHCYRILAYCGHQPEVGVGHWATGASPLATGGTLYSRLAKLADPPPAAGRAIAAGQALAGKEQGFDLSEEFSVRAEVTRALAEPPEPGALKPELDPPSLAALLADHSFGEAHRRAFFLRYKLAVPLDDWLEEAKPLYEQHPFAMTLRRLSPNPAEQTAAIEQSLQADIDFLEIGAHDFIYCTTNVTNRQNNIQAILHRHMDYVATDQAHMLTKYYLEESQSAVATFALWPASSAGRFGMLKWKWNDIQNDLPQWQKWAEDDPELLAAMGGALLNRQKYKEAAEIFEKACQRAPSFAAYTQLSQCYIHLKQDEDWLRTAEAALKLEDHGLNHARFNSMIANYHRRHRDYAKAVPYAEAAGQSYSEWGLRIAGEANEDIGRFDRAEEYFRAAAERYNTLDWFLFTRRTQHGDGPGALAFTKRLLTDTLGPRASRILVAQFSILTDDQPRAITVLSGLYAEDGGEMALPALLFTCHEDLKQTEKRDGLLKRVQFGGLLRDVKHPSAGLYDLLILFSKDLAAGGKAEFAPAVLEEARERVKEFDRRFVFDYVLGRYLETRGKPEEAKASYLRAWTQEPSSNLNRHLSGWRLEQMGVNLGEHKTEFEKQKEAARRAGPAK